MNTDGTKDTNFNIGTGFITNSEEGPFLNSSVGQQKFSESIYKGILKYNLDTEEVWNSILKNNGSVQHLDFPTKGVFKSAIEISPKEVLI